MAPPVSVVPVDPCGATALANAQEKAVAVVMLADGRAAGGRPGDKKGCQWHDVLSSLHDGPRRDGERSPVSSPGASRMQAKLGERSRKG